MSLSVWLASIPGVSVGGIIAYANQRRLQSSERTWARRADIYMELVDHLGRHNREMWQRLYDRSPPSSPFPAALSNETEIVRRAEILASDSVQMALNELLTEIINWRERDIRRLESEPRRFLGESPLFGERWHTPQDDFIAKGESVDDKYDSLCSAIRMELRKGLLRRR
ncbi:hypothetical protein [Spirillospora sp. CA-128828]|uniref:hypothetical protein n=1 Tax=Spirillospora sp. CA-128828 TaxID=3240033 RepID=UPI003D8C60FF